MQQTFTFLLLSIALSKTTSTAADMNVTANAADSGDNEEGLVAGLLSTTSGLVAVGVGGFGLLALVAVVAYLRCRYHSTATKADDKGTPGPELRPRLGSRPQSRKFRSNTAYTANPAFVETNDDDVV